MSPLLKDSVSGPFFRQPVGQGDQNKADHGFEESNCRAEAEIQLHKTDTVDKGVNDIHGFIDQLVIHIEDLIKTRVEDIAQT